MLSTAAADKANAALRVMQARRLTNDANRFRSKRGSKTSAPTSSTSPISTSAWSAPTTAASPRRGLPADDQMARSVIPAGTGALRDFSYIAPDIPEFIAENCVGCMECVTQCPDTAILGKVAEPATLERAPGAASPTRRCAADMAAQWVDHQQVLTPCSRRRAWAAASSASSSTPPSARGAPSAWTPAAITTR